MKILEYIIIFLLSLWVLVSHFLNQSLSNYATNQYYNIIFISSIFLLVISILGFFFSKKLFSSFLDHIKLLLNDRVTVLFIIGSILSLLIQPVLSIIFVLLIIFYQDKGPGVDLSYLFKKNILITITLINLTFGIVYPSTAISVASASQKTSMYNVISTDKNKRLIDYFGNETKDFNILDWITAINNSDNSQVFDGKYLSVSGFVHDLPDLPDGFVKVSRFIVRCCAADAVPVGLLLQKSNTEIQLESGQWINVQGVIKYDKQKDLLFILPSSIEFIDQPKNPYVY